MLTCFNCRWSIQKELITLKCLGSNWETKDTSYGFSSIRKCCREVITCCIFCLSEMNDNLIVKKDYKKDVQESEEEEHKKKFKELKKQGIPLNDSKLNDLVRKIIKEHNK